MTPTPIRGLARLLAQALPRLARPRDRYWAEAMAQESAHIEPARDAALFLLGCAASLGRRRLAFWTWEYDDMESIAASRRLARLGLACGAAAMAAGLILMKVAGAPAGYMAVNPLTGLVALLAFPFLIRLLAFLARRPAAVAAALGALLLATALWGVSLDGVARWVRTGPITLQVSFLVLPLLIGLVARLPAERAAPAIFLAVAGLALQPDRAMAGALLAAVAVVAMGHRNRGWTALTAVAAAGFVAAVLRPDPMPAIAFVDQLVPFAFSTHWTLGALVGVAMVLPLLPFAFGLRKDDTGESRSAVAALGALWLGAALAAVIGNYPSPLVGYGASPILGYALSFAFLAAAQRAPVAGAESTSCDTSPSAPASHRSSLWSEMKWARRLGRAA